MDLSQEDSEVVKKVCRCCLTSGYYSLWEEYIVNNEKVVFGDLLSECFDIQLSRNESVIKDQICKDCITSLIEADKFKRKVLNAQEQYYNSSIVYHASQQLNQMPQLRIFNDSHKMILDAEDPKIGINSVKPEDNFYQEEYLEDDYIMEEEFLNSEIFTDSEVPVKFEVSGFNNMENYQEPLYEETENEYLQFNIPTSPPPLVPLSGKKNPVITSSLLNNIEKNIQQCLDAMTEGRTNVSQACSIYTGNTNDSTKKITKRAKIQKNPTRKEIKKDVIQNIIKQLRNSDLSLQEASAAQNMTPEQFIRLLKTHFPYDYKHIRYLERMKARDDDNGTTIPIDDELSDDEMKIIKVVRKHCKPTKENVTNAIQAIRNGMTYTAAYKMFKVTKRVLQKFVMSDLEVTDLNIDIVLDQGKNKKHSIEFVKHCTNLIKDGKITKRQAMNWFNISKSCLESGLRATSFIEHNSAKHKIMKNGIHIVEVSSNLTDPNQISFDVDHRLKLEKNVQTILNLTNATPFLINRGKTICAYCIKYIDKPDELRDHTIAAHAEERLTKVPDMLRPALHKEIMRLDLHQLKCTQCDTDLKNIDHLYQHLEIEHNYTIEQSEKKFIVPFVLHYFKSFCAICDQRLGDNVKLEQHMDKHYDNYVCHECGKTFITLVRLKAHNTRERQSKGHFKCPHCTEELVGAPTYREHLALRHNLGTRRCHYCSERFRERYAHHLHMMEKHRDKVKDIVCECGKVFQWRTFYLQHFRKVHLRERNYSCCYCDKKFFTNYGVKKHMQMHVKERAFICKVCHVRLPLASVLNEHWKAHAENNPNIKSNKKIKSL